MNILIITQYFWPENFRINDLASGLREKGHTVSVLTGIPNYPDGKFYKGYGLRNKRCEDYGGIPLYRVPLAPRGKGTGFRLALNYLSFAVAASMWGPFLCKDKYDVIFVYEPSPITVGIPAIVMKRIKTAPVMFWMQDLWPESLTAAGAVRSKIVLKLFEVLVSIIYRSCDIILAQSRAFISNIRRVAGESKQVYYFPNSAEELYRPITVKPDARERMHMPPGFRVLFAGNIGAAQDFPTILETAEKLKDNPDIQWVILGDGRLHRWLDEQVEVRGLRNTVHLIGRHPAETMPRFFALADALLVTLKKEPIFSLTIPSKVQSYLACAKPVIAALDGEGARVIEEAGAGFVCPSEDPDALARAVVSMYTKSPEERRLMGESGRRYFERNFERTMLLNRLEKWMQEIVASDGKRYSA